jgi:hypothetical protein
MLTVLGPDDEVEYFSTRLNGTRTEPTKNREDIAAAVDRMVTGPGVLWVCLRDLTDLLLSFAPDVPRGRSTTIAVISRGHPSGASPAGDSGGGPCTPRREGLRRLEEAIGTAQVNLHFFTVDETNRSWGLDTIAGNTGGTSSLLTWGSRDGLARAVQSSGTFYRITFDWAAPADRAQRVELRAADKSLKVRTSTIMRGK